MNLERATEKFKIVSLKDSKGENSGYYMTKIQDEYLIQLYFDKAFRTDEIDPEEIRTEADNFLCELGIFRILAHEVTTSAIVNDIR
tara:strand:+ start:2253 stop:2510 length:258 start_codon:yes stop_codon:yes gene_type:complete